ncbi:unnamed protein product [Lymnaea stagnalis]|uniref:Kinase n=1 Tax=Lymnaea stagnalis TaxID=6523 RepID=A0AAV2HHB2_LYMST
MSTDTVCIMSFDDRTGQHMDTSANDSFGAGKTRQHSAVTSWNLSSAERDEVCGCDEADDIFSHDAHDVIHASPGEKSSPSPPSDATRHHTTPHDAARNHTRHVHKPQRSVNGSRTSASSSTSSKSSSLASISEEEVLSMMEMMGEKEILSAMAPCDCDECMLQDPDLDGHVVKIPLHRQSSWRKIRSFILWSPFIQVFKKHRYPWIQLAGHQGNFHAGEAGSVLKKLDAREQLCFVKLMADKLKDCVPEYRGDVEKNGESYIQLQDLLCTFNHPCVMDVKMGVRTYLEDELQKARKSPSLRKDMYLKMIEIDTTAPTTEENEHKAVTKPRYMQWRDEMSSSVELGFRVEGIKKSDGNSSKDFKKTKTRDNIVDILKSFVGDNETIVEKYIKRLKEIMHTQETSDFFSSHEVIGSSLLFVHDVDDNVGVWMIDFGKTEPLPSGVVINHRNTWQEGNHEDGYLFGLDNLVSIFEEVQTGLKSSAV